MNARSKRYLIHHVFFWLKDPGSPDDRERLIMGLDCLRPIDAVRELRPEFVDSATAAEARECVEAIASASFLRVTALGLACN
jgi:hypothetical protein